MPLLCLSGDLSLGHKGVTLFVRKHLSLLYAVVFLGGGLLFSLPSEGAIPNFHEVEEGFFRGGQPKEEEIKALRSLGIRTVISLRDEEDVIQWEKEVVEKNGMTFISIPLNWKRTPTQEEAHTFLSTVAGAERRPLFVHCQEGRDRSGTMVALYRIAAQGVSVEEAYREAKVLGLREAAFPLRQFILEEAVLFQHPSIRTEVSLDFPDVVAALLFYGGEGFIALFSIVTAVTCLRRPELILQIQKKFYARINWKMEPLSLKKELRNTRIIGGILSFVSFLLVLTLVLFS